MNTVSVSFLKQVMKHLVNIVSQHDHLNITDSLYQINLVDSKYTGSHRVIGLGTTTFKFNIPNYPEASSYSSSTANLYYTTKSSNAYGAINTVEVLNS